MRTKYEMPEMEILIATMEDIFTASNVDGLINGGIGDGDSGSLNDILGGTNP